MAFLTRLLKKAIHKQFVMEIRDGGIMYIITD